MKWLTLGLVSLVVGALLFALLRFGPVPLTLAWAADEPNGLDATPPITLPFDADAARAALAREVYGDWPKGSVEVLRVERVPYLGGELSNLDLRASTVRATGEFGISLVRRDPSVPLIIWSSFSPRGAAIAHPSVPGAPMEGMGSDMIEGVFGRYIQTPPVETILDAGYGLAVLHPPELVPDDVQDGEAALTRLFGDRETRTGAVAAWAWTAKLALDALEESGEARGPVIAAGHSRYGKSALVWAAWDSRVDGVIAHQSGTGGASLSRDKRGETVAQITESYPHWFAKGYAEERLSIDQHHLLSLIAPRPVLLGNARRDVWSDPNGALRAARGAATVYGVKPPKSLADWRPDSPLAIWIRPGTHGVVEEDWPAFLKWMNGWFGLGAGN